MGFPIIDDSPDVGKYPMISCQGIEAGGHREEKKKESEDKNEPFFFAQRHLARGVWLGACLRSVAAQSLLKSSHFKV
jgi:hypothetical protein